MRKKSYISEDKENILERKDSYIILPDEDTMGVPVSRDYAPLPEEYDVFSAIDNDVIEPCSAEQKSLFGAFLEAMRSALKKQYREEGIQRPLSKMELSLDGEQAIILNWPYISYRAYVDIEKQISDSFYGVILQGDNNQVQTMTGSVNQENCGEVAHNILGYVLEGI